MSISTSPLKPGTGMLLVSTIVGMLAFAGVLLFGPTPAEPPRVQATGPAARDMVRRDMISLVSRGLDEDAIRGTLAHLKTDPEFGWGWRIVYQLSSRSEAFYGHRDLAEKTLLAMPPEQLADRGWGWDGRTEGIALMIAGKTDQARAVFADSIQKIRTQPQFGDGLIGFLEAAMLALGDQPDEAFAALHRAVVEEGYLGNQWLTRSPDLDSLRDDPRLAELIALANELVLESQSPPPPSPPSDRDARPGPIPDSEPNPAADPARQTNSGSDDP